MSSSTNTLTVGIDVGGTFTDLLAIDSASGAVKLAKVPTTIDNQALGFMAALAAAGAEPATCRRWCTARRPRPTPCSSARSPGSG
jgi:N-methylhydantoinase A